MPQPPARAFSQKDLPPSVESAYYRKCIDLRRRISDIEENNDGTRLRISRLNRGIQKMRLERAFLLDQLNKHMEYNVDDSDRSSSPLPTPTDKPLRSKRSHNRKGTPPTDTQNTPDPSRQSSSYFNTIATPASPPHASAPQAPNGAPILPPLHPLPQLHQQQQQQQQQSQPQLPHPALPRATYFDPAYNEQRPTPLEADGHRTRQRAYSSAQPPPTEPALPLPPQNGDIEMTDASFASINR